MSSAELTAERLPVPGTAYGLGIGPGEPDLITLKAYNILQKADVIAYPALEDGVSLARQIVDPHIPEGRIEIAIRIEMGKPPIRSMTQQPSKLASIWPMAKPLPSCARAIRSSMAASCICLADWRRPDIRSKPFRASVP